MAASSMSASRTERGSSRGTHIVNERHIRRCAVLFTTNKHPKRWGEVLHDDDRADAIVDRVRLLRLDGASIRTEHLAEGELVDDQPDPQPSRFSGKHRSQFPERTSR
jgi:hypothetical protein